MTPEEVKEYGERVERMVKKESAYSELGYFHYEPIYTNKEVALWETKKKLQHLMRLKHRY
jgi:hypothetical protein